MNNAVALAEWRVILNLWLLNFNLGIMKFRFWVDFEYAIANH